MAVIKQLKNFLKTQNIFPVTRTKAVYDDNDQRLDTKLASIDTQISELNNNLSNLKVDKKVITTEIGGNAYLGEYDAVFSVVTDTPDTTLNLFQNNYGMFYCHITKSSTGEDYNGNFILFILGITH